MMRVGPLEKKVETWCAWAPVADEDDVPLRNDAHLRVTTAQAVTELRVARMLQRRVIGEALEGGGTSEIQKKTMARRVPGLPPSP